VKAHFGHEQLRVYQSSVQFVAWTVATLKEAKPLINARGHLLRASESIPMNIIWGHSQHTKESQAQPLDVAYGSSLECAGCLDVLSEWHSIPATTVQEGKILLNHIVGMLIQLRSASLGTVREESPAYLLTREQQCDISFAHERLRAYQSALRFIRWYVRLVNLGELVISKAKRLDRHGTAILLNIAEGNGKFSHPDRCRFLSISLSATLQAAGMLDILAAGKDLSAYQQAQGKEHLQDIAQTTGALRRYLQRHPPISSNPNL
jgi:four helix bundle protein